MQHVPPQEPGKKALDALIRQAFLRASSMIVEPAPQAASNNVNGKEVRTMPKYKKSLSSFVPADSWSFRTRRAIGSRLGAMLDAKPAGLSRSEKCFRRTT